MIPDILVVKNTAKYTDLLNLKPQLCIRCIQNRACITFSALHTILINQLCIILQYNSYQIYLADNSFTFIQLMQNTSLTFQHQDIHFALELLKAGVLHTIKCFIWV